MRKLIYMGCLLLGALGGSLLLAQAHSELRLDEIRYGKLKYAGFHLKTTKTIQVTAYGGGVPDHGRRRRKMMYDPSGMFAYGWIINTETRDVVWKMTVDNTDEDPLSRFGRKFKGEINLPAGDYEVYFYARKPYLHWISDGFFSLGKFLDMLIRGDEDWDELEARLKLVIRGVDQVFTDEHVRNVIRQKQKAAVVSITDLGNSDYRQQGFSLTRGGEFRVYGIGEAFHGDEFDYGWIVTADSDRKVWEMVEESSEHAGGAIKNRVWRETLYLTPGSYWVYYITDDSHSPERWNANPPSDPFYWGITIEGVPGRFDPTSVKKLSVAAITPIVELTRLGSDEYVESRFRLKKPMRVRILAVGEGEDGEMYDYGWIVDDRTGQKVWEMTYARTTHAGGARKNRAVDEVITLQPGSYTVYFVTDGSHAFRDWNARPPYNPTRWGITIFPADPHEIPPSAVEVSAPAERTEDEPVLVSLVKVRNDEHRKKILTLDQPTRIRIYVIGEGDWDEMYDYAWIENRETGEIVWEMSYEDTRWAGGARKNRKVNKVITLPAGEYMVHYVTDDSHAYRSWNADPPDDASHYGITIYRMKTKGETK